jgi:hypothetical protein
VAISTNFDHGFLGPVRGFSKFILNQFPMAKLIGGLKMRGKIDGLCCRLQKDGSVVVQSQPGPQPEQVKTGKNFDLTRRNASEFGKVTRDAMLFRHALGYLTRALRDPKFNSHVIKQMHQVAFSDTESEYGSRHANKGNLQLLEGFDLNHELSLERALPVRLEHSLDMTTGTIQLRVPSCIVRRKKVLPAGATHFKIVSCAAALDLNKHRYTNTIAESELLTLSKQVPAVELEHSLGGKPGQVMVHTVGMVFYKVEGGEAEMLRGGVMRVVEVVRVAEAERSVAGVPAVLDIERIAAAAEITAATLSFTTITPIQVIEKKQCAPCILQNTLLFIVEKEPIVLPAASPEIPEGASPDTNDFTVGITDALGLPLQDPKMQQLVIASNKGSRKRSRLKGYLRRRLE